MNIETSQNQFAVNNSHRFALVGAGAAAIGAVCLISTGCSVTTISCVAFGALSLVALAYCSLHAYRRLGALAASKCEASINETPAIPSGNSADRGSSDGSINPDSLGKSTSVISGKSKSNRVCLKLDSTKDKPVTLSGSDRLAPEGITDETPTDNEGPINTLSNELLAGILNLAEHPQAGLVSKIFNGCDIAATEMEHHRLDPFIQTYNLEQKKEDETTWGYMRRCIAAIHEKQNSILGEDISLEGLHTLTALKQIEEREESVENQVLDQFCWQISHFTPPPVESTLAERAAHWQSQLELNGPGITVLDLRRSELKRLPYDIRKLTNLTRLDLSRNKLQSLPESIGDLKNLTELKLDRNQLQSLPESIGNLTNLTRLYLWYNQLQSLPESIGNLTNLTGLVLWRNQLQSLPESIGSLTNLTELDLRDNQLQSLPESIGNLTNLTRLYLWYNQLQSLPESIGNLTNLTVLNLSDNQLQSLHESIGNLTNLTELKLDRNQLSSLPESIGNLTNLTRLDLSDNQLSSLPESIGNLTNLTELVLSRNKLQSLPESKSRGSFLVEAFRWLKTLTTTFSV